jgi:hypothetical protein
LALLRGLEGNSRLAKVVSEKSVARPRLSAVLFQTRKEAVNLCVHQDGGHPSIGIPEILETETSTAKSLM